MADAFIDALAALPSHGPTVDITFEDLSVEITVPQVQTGLTNVAEAVVDFVKLPYTLVKGASNTKKLRVLQGLTGAIPAGRATLVISNAGGGKSTFLNALAGRLDLAAQGVGGRVLWNGAAPGECGAQACKIAAVAAQQDIHQPLLTVRETFQFAFDSCYAALPGDAPQAVRLLRERLVDHVIDALGLRECAHVRVGDDMTRGISGGQKKRVTIGEAMLTGARVLCLDQISDGLDAATAAEIVRTLVRWAHVTRGTLVCSLQAPTPEVFQAFDDVLLLSDGHCLYHGPVGGVEGYLAGLGFVAPSYMDVADYALTVCVSPAFAATEYAADLPPGTPPPLMKTRPELAKHWAAVAGKLAPPPATATGGVVLASEAERAQWGVAQVHSAWRHASLLFKRQSKIVLRFPPISFGKVAQFAITSAIFGSVYYQISPDDFVSIFSVFAFTTAAVSFSAFPEIPVLSLGKRNATRQIKGGFYDPVSYVLSIVLNGLPIGTISVIVTAVILYWMAGLQASAGRFFFFFFVLVCHSEAVTALFRLYALVLPREELAQAAAGITTGTFLLFNGFYAPLNNIPDFMLSIYYISPFSWSVRSMVNNQFGAPYYQTLVGSPPATKEAVYLSSFGFQYSTAWQWGGIGLLIFYAILFGPILSSVAVAKLPAREPPGSQRIEESDFIASAAASRRALVASSGGSAEGKQKASLHSATSIGHIAAQQASAVLPFTPVTLAFDAVTYEVKLPSGAIKPLLRGVSGTARPGRMVALMGASGAGKTTLMDVLAFRKTQGTVGGGIYLNGVAAQREAVSKLGAYCEQEDVHADYATVREALQFSAHLRLPASVGTEQREAFVDLVLDLLEMRPLAQRRTGSLAPGERKRLTIAVELCGNPSILFLDEPTTGLDARAAAVVMRVIRNVADTGRTVVCTIHQPSAEVFLSFDELCVLVPGGYQAYMGPLHGAGETGHTASALVGFLQSVPGVTPLPAHQNPATWMLEQMGSGPSGQAGAEAPAQPPSPGASASAVKVTDAGAAGAAEAGAAPPASKSAAADVTAVYAASALANEMREAVAASKAGNHGGDAVQLDALAHLPRPGFWVQFGLLFQRQMRFMWRNTAWNFLRFFVFTFLSIFFGLLYLQINDNSQSGLFAKIAVALNSFLFTGIISLNTSLPSYGRLRAVFYREKAAGYYKPLAYPLSLALTELPWAIGLGLLFNAINYFLVGFTPAAGPFFTALLASVTASYWFTLLGQGFIAFFPVPLLAAIVAGPTIQISILFAGVNLPVNALPSGWQWMYYVDGMAQALRVFMLPQYQGANGQGLVYIPQVQQLQTKEQFVNWRLGTEPGNPQSGTWPSFGWLVLITGTALILGHVWYVVLCWQKR